MVSYEIIREMINNSDLFNAHLFRYAFYLVLRAGVKDYVIYTEQELGLDKVGILVIKRDQSHRKYYVLIVIKVIFC